MPPPKPLPTKSQRRAMATEARARAANSRVAKELARSKMTRDQLERLRAKRRQKILRNRVALALVIMLILAAAGIFYLGNSRSVTSSAIRTHRKTGTTTSDPSRVTTTNPPPTTTSSTGADQQSHAGVAVASCTFIDYSRSTYNFYTKKSLPYRLLDTYIFYPNKSQDLSGANSGSLDASKSPYPAIVFAEGYKVTPFTYRALLDFWVSKGFVVIAPMFPDTNAKAVREMHNVAISEKDTSNEPADVAFVTKSVVNDAEVISPNCKILYHLINPDELMLAGQSDGAQVVAALMYDQDYMYLLGDISFKAVEVLSGDEIGVGGYTATQDSPPVLFVQSATDTCNPPQEAQDLYDAIPSSQKWFLELYNANHLPPYDGNDKPAFAIVSKVTSDFFLLAEKNTLPGSQFIDLGDSSPQVAHMTFGATAPVLPNLPISSKECYIQ